MSVLLRPMAGLLLFEALVALWVVTGVAVGLQALQSRILGQAQLAELRWLVTAETASLVAGMRANGQGFGAASQWRHYQQPALGGCGMMVEGLLEATALARRQLCQFETGLTQRLVQTDFAYVVCAQTAPLILPSSTLGGGPLRLSCPVGAGGQEWVVHVLWRLEGVVYAYSLRVAYV